jgi:hypothetical protein
MCRKIVKKFKKMRSDRSKVVQKKCQKKEH